MIYNPYPNLDNVINIVDVMYVGVLVEAMKKGHWIILDELNLAPTDVLEALNRVRLLSHKYQLKY